MANRSPDIEYQLERLLYRGPRFTQHSPVMPDVWIKYGCQPRARHDLLLTPRWENTTEELAAGIRERLGLTTVHEAGRRDWGRVLERAAVKLAHNRSVVAAKLTFEQLVKLLPLSGWWFTYLVSGPGSESYAQEFFRAGRRHEVVQNAVVQALIQGTWAPPPLIKHLRPTSHLLWLVRVLGAIAMVHRHSVSIDACLDAIEQRSEPTIEKLVREFFDLFEDTAAPEQRPLWSIDRNRPSDAAIYKSTATVKADAARHVFEVTGKNITWAVVDSGIDATHLAFRKRDDNGAILRPAFAHKDSPCDSPGDCRDPRHWINNTRVKATYDFRRLRDLLALTPDDVDYVLLPDEDKRPSPELQGPSDELHETWAELLKSFPWLGEERGREQLFSLQDNLRTRDRDKSDPKDAPFDWARWTRWLEVAHGPDYAVAHIPADCHGTHVAGILAADWRPEDSEEDKLEYAPESPFKGARVGVCPEIELIDLRVLGSDEEPNDQPVTKLDGELTASSGDEFVVLSALEFVRHYNNRYAHMEIHGVNLSVSLPHKVASFACGHTPVCNECDKLSADGVVVVAAAGNNGRMRYREPDGVYDDGYRVSSITDPGNAQSVITVGATHRSSPQTYGVSYFSSRGPTGDGRFKPDLVAPGEKVVSTRPHNEEIGLDGTSMAAPHVSGAAALLMCRYEELRGRPQDIKRILCATATDLGRERYYQGAGLVDILRALQST